MSRIEHRKFVSGNSLHSVRGLYIRGCNLGDSDRKFQENELLIGAVIIDV